VTRQKPLLPPHLQPDPVAVPIPIVIIISRSKRSHGRLWLIGLRPAWVIFHAHPKRPT